MKEHMFVSVKKLFVTAFLLHHVDHIITFLTHCPRCHVLANEFKELINRYGYFRYNIRDAFSPLVHATIVIFELVRPFDHRTMP